MKLCKRIAAALLAAVLFALCIPAIAADMPEFPEAPEGYDGYVSFSVSALTMGWGYIIDPVLVPVHEGETLDTVTIRAFEQLGAAYTVKEGMETFYLTGVACDQTEQMIPEIIMEQFEIYPDWADENLGMPYGYWTGEYEDDGFLSEFEYSTFSGWMFLENGVSGFSGADATVVTAGSDYAWYFTVYGWGMDYGVNDGWGMFPEFDNPMEGVDRTDIHKALAAIYADEELTAQVHENAEEEHNSLLEAFGSYGVSQEVLDELLEALLDKLSGGEEYQHGDVNMDGVIDTADALLLLRHALGIIELDEEALALGAMNDDGVIDTVDALLLLRLALGIE